MKILAIDTSNQPLSVAVLEDDHLLATKTINISRNHSKTLMPIVAELLEDCHLDSSAIDRIVVAEGPGSYTGLRIGVTTAKVLASTLNKELVGVSSLKTIAANVTPNSNWTVVPYFDARNLNVFAGGYHWENDRLATVIEDQHTSFKDLVTQLRQVQGQIILVGPVKSEFNTMVSQMLGKRATFMFDFQIPQAAVIGKLGRYEKPVDIDTFVPQYRRLTQAELQWMEKHPEERDQHASYIEKV